MIDRISNNPNICHGKPSIRGLSYTVENIMKLLASGITIDELLEDYPDLVREDFLAGLNFASKLVHVKSIHIIAL